MTTEPTPEIAPRIVDGEPTCSGEACPAQKLSKGYFICSVQSEPECEGKSRSVVLANAGYVCIPGIRRQRDELHEKNKEAVVSLVAHSDNETRLLNASIQACAERDAARRELCEHYAGIHSKVRADLLDSSWHHFENVLRRYAASRGWGYLYETPEGGEG